MNIDTILSIRGLSVMFKTEIGEQLAVNNVSLDMKRSQTTAIVGESGSGKTTSLRLIAGLERPDSGELHFGQRLISSNSTFVTPQERKIGMVFQKPNPFPKSIFDNVAFGPRINNLKENLEQLVETSLQRADLWNEVKDRLKDNALELSGGQQQRLCIARALAVNPEVILMDEPASALDPISTQKIEDLIKILSENVTIIIVTHNMQQAARVSDYAACMMADENRIGELVEYGTNKQIFGNPVDKRTEDYVTGRIG